MDLRRAEKLWKDKSFEAYTSNMAAVSFRIERTILKDGYDYCVSQYVSHEKSAEYWPHYRGGVCYRSDLTTYGEEFIATESKTGKGL